MSRRANSRRLWHGEQLDGTRIFLAASGLALPSQNDKTGDMVQMYVFVQDHPPLEAAQLGLDAAVCGDCVLRKYGLAPLPDKQKPCYVDLGRLRSVWNSTHDGPEDYQDARRAVLKTERPVRWTAYGDPTAIPLWLMKDLSLYGHTGYTSQWRRRPEYKHYLQASVHSIAEKREAEALGWRTYRSMAPGEELDDDETLCPGSHTLMRPAGRGTKKRRTNCATCRGCDGRTRSYAEETHGILSKKLTPRTRP